jgi:hypothetical protein
MSLSIMSIGFALADQSLRSISQMHQRRDFMRFVALWTCVIGFMMGSVILILPPAQLSLAEDGKQNFGSIEARK